MFTFGNRSRSELSTAHQDLRVSCERALGWGVYDFAVICGHRGEEAQDHAFMTGVSSKRWPNSKHNHVTASGQPMSDAIDFAPWVQLEDGTMGIPWHDTHAFAVVAGLIIAAGASLGHKFRWGGDWNRNGLSTDQRLLDYGHIERVT